MTKPNPQQGNDATSRPNDDRGPVVIPLPRGQDSGAGPGDNRWEFETNVRWVGGTEGVWLRHELAAVIRDLLVWAYDDMARHTDHGDSEQERAA